MRGGLREAKTGQGVQGGEEAIVESEGGEEAGQGALLPLEEVEVGGRTEEVEALWKKIGGELLIEVIRGEALEMGENQEELEKTEAKNMIKEVIEVKEETEVILEKEVLLGDIKDFL